MNSVNSVKNIRKSSTFPFSCRSFFSIVFFAVLISFPFLEQEMRKIKKWILKDENHTDSNCVVITLICHGDYKGQIMDRDKRRSWIIEDFVGDLSLVDTLIGKPKVLIVQACRGSK